MINIFKKKEYNLPFAILKNKENNNDIVLSLHKKGKSFFVEAFEKTPDKRKDGSKIIYDSKMTYYINEKINKVEVIAELVKKGE